MTCPVAIRIDDELIVCHGEHDEGSDVHQSACGTWNWTGAMSWVVVELEANPLV